MLIAGGARQFQLCCFFELYALISLCIPDSHATGQGHSMQYLVTSHDATAHSSFSARRRRVGHWIRCTQPCINPVQRCGQAGIMPPAVLAFLPAKVCRFLYEFHAIRFESLELAPLLDDGDEVYCILRPDQLNVLLRRIKLRVFQQHTRHFRLFNVLVGHTKHSCAQRVYCEPFPNRKYHKSHRQDHMLGRPPGMQRGNLILSADAVFYCRVLLLFSMVVATNTGGRPWIGV